MRQLYLPTLELVSSIESIDPCFLSIASRVTDSNRCLPDGVESSNLIKLYVYADEIGFSIQLSLLTCQGGFLLLKFISPTK